MHNCSTPIWEWRFGLCVLALLIGRACDAQPAVPVDDSAQQFVADYVKAWNAGDTEALGRKWTSDGELIDAQGVAVDRKALLESRLAKREETRPALSIDLEKVRFLPPNVAVVDGASTLATPQGSVLQQTKFSGVLVKQDGTWRIRLIRHLSTLQSRQSPPEEPLKELAWIVGEWVGIGNGMRVYSTAQWDLGKRYIVSRFEYKPEGSEAYEAEVRVGWDPEAHSVKSWYFDSRGVLSTTVWGKSGDHWLGAITGTQSDGESFTGTMAITQIDNDSYLRTLSNMKLGGRAVPDQELRMLRVATQPAE